MPAGRRGAGRDVSTSRKVSSRPQPGAGPAGGGARVREAGPFASRGKQFPGLFPHGGDQLAATVVDRVVRRPRGLDLPDHV